MRKDYSELLLELVRETKELHKCTLHNDLIKAGNCAHKCGKIAFELEKTLLGLAD